MFLLRLHGRFPVRDPTLPERCISVSLISPSQHRVPDQRCSANERLESLNGLNVDLHLWLDSYLELVGNEISEPSGARGTEDNNLLAYRHGVVISFASFGLGRMRVETIAA